jgi:hypothetical protein
MNNQWNERNNDNNIWLRKSKTCDDYTNAIYIVPCRPVARQWPRGKSPVTIGNSNRESVLSVRLVELVESRQLEQSVSCRTFSKSVRTSAGKQRILLVSVIRQRLVKAQQVPVFISPRNSEGGSYTHRPRVSFSLPPTSRRTTVEVLQPASIRGWPGWVSESESVTSRLAVYRPSVRLGVKPLETHDQTFFFQLNSCVNRPYVTSSLTRGRVCRLQLLPASPAQSFSCPESREAHDHFPLFQLRDSPNQDTTGPQIYMHPRNRMARLYPQALGSLFVSSWDSQGYGRDIRPRHHSGFLLLSAARDPPYIASGRLPKNPVS